MYISSTMITSIYYIDELYAVVDCIHQSEDALAEGTSTESQPNANPDISHCLYLIEVDNPTSAPKQFLFQNYQYSQPPFAKKIEFVFSVDNQAIMLVSGVPFLSLSQKDQQLTLTNNVPILWVYQLDTKNNKIVQMQGINGKTLRDSLQIVKITDFQAFQGSIITLDYNSPIIGFDLKRTGKPVNIFKIKTI